MKPKKRPGGSKTPGKPAKAKTPPKAAASPEASVAPKASVSPKQSRPARSAKVAKGSKPSRPPGPSRGEAILLGVGLDNTDGHKRITTGDSFAVVGGSAETHERMAETVIKTFEELRGRGKRLADVGRAELAEIVHKASPR